MGFICCVHWRRSGQDVLDNGQQAVAMTLPVDLRVTANSAARLWRTSSAVGYCKYQIISDLSIALCFDQAHEYTDLNGTVTSAKGVQILTRHSNNNIIQTTSHITTRSTASDVWQRKFCEWVNSRNCTVKSFEWSSSLNTDHLLFGLRNHKWCMWLLHIESWSQEARSEFVNKPTQSWALVQGR